MAVLQPSFRIGNVDHGQSMTQIVNQGLGGFLNKRVEQLTAEEDKAQRKLERQQDVDFRQAQADTAKEQFTKTFGLQEQQAARAQQDQDRKLLGDQRLAEYSARLAGGLERGEMSTANADKANTMLDAAINSGMTPEEAVAKIFGTYTDSGVQSSKGTADKLLQYSAPKTAVDKAAYVQQAGFSSPDYGAEPLLNLQTTKAKPFLDQAAADKAYDQQLSLTKMKIAADAKEGEKNRSVKTEKFTPYTATVGFDANGQPTSDPSKMAHKSNIIITRPDQEAAVQRKYGNAIQLGTVTDYAPNQTGTAKAKSVYDLPDAKLLNEQYGMFGSKGGDVSRILRTADVVLKNNPSLGAAGALGLVQSQVDANTFTDEIDVTKINELGLGILGTKWNKVHKK